METVLRKEAEILGRLDELTALLSDAVEHGASIGFTWPLARGEAENYWRKVAAEVGAGNKIVVLVMEEGGALAGSAQLARESRPNGRHRAEVQKVMVRFALRGGGLGARLMQQIEWEAQKAGCTLLFLDTSLGAGGATEFYRRLGYVFVGSIPDYATDPDGRLRPNAIFYKQLGN